jgi:hypothetical protein
VIIFYFITLLVIIALGIIFWLIWKESSIDDGPQSKKTEKTITAASLLDKLGLEKNIKRDPSSNTDIKTLFTNLLSPKKAPSITASTIKTPLKEPVENDGEHHLPKSGTAALRLDNHTQQSIAEEVALAIKNDELQKENLLIKENYQKIELLLNEKTTELERVQKELEQEHKHRKEFNKIKDLIEKELKDEKDASKRTEIELQSTKAEHQVSTNRISQLEEKIKLIEKKSNEKDSLIDELTQKLGALKNVPKSDALVIDDQSQELPKPENPITVITTETETANASSDSEQIPQAADPNPLAKTSPENIQKISNPLNLTPVSNLENTYEADAAPKPDTEKETQNDVPDSQQSNINDAPVSDIIRVENQEDTQPPTDPDVDAFLRQHLKPNTDIIKTESSEDQPTLSDLVESLPENQSIQNQHTLENDLPDLEPPAEQEEIDTNIETLPSAKKSQVHLAPDIFKDIEKQFREIENEMNVTEKDQNIEPDTDKDKDK